MLQTLALNSIFSESLNLQELIRGSLIYEDQVMLSVSLSLVRFGAGCGYEDLIYLLKNANLGIFVR